MGVMTRERFQNLLEPYVWKVYTQTMNQEGDIIPQLYDVNTSTKAFEKFTGIGSLGLMKKWNGTVYYDDVRALWDKTYIHQKYSMGIMIERDLWDDAQYSEVKDRVNQVMLSIFRTRQIHATIPFEKAFVTSFTDDEGDTISTAGPDGVALCAVNHPTFPGASAAGDLQSNLGSSALSLDALETTKLAMKEFKDDRGKKLLIVPDTVIIPPNLEYQFDEMMKSEGRYDTANRVDNVRRGAYKKIVLDFLTDTNAWFMVDSKLMKQYLKWFERRKPTPERDEDFDTEVLKWKFISRYSFGFHGWHFVYGNNPG